MADDTEHGSSTPPSFDEFAKRLDAARAARKGARGTNGVAMDASASAGLGLGFRIATELVVAVLIGGLLGYGIDYLAGISPIGLILGFFIGVAAGLLNVQRSMARMTEEAETGRSGSSEPEDG